MAAARHTVKELRDLALAAQDGSGYFPALYARVTERVADSIEAGRFDDGPRMDAFAATFASYFTRVCPPHAVRPRCWQACWDVAADRSLLILQHLLLGINAHVNHDLPLTVVEVAGGGDLQRIRGDFDAINDVLTATYSDVLRDLDRVSRWTNVAAGVGGGRLFNFSLTAARRQAWAAAERLHALDAAGRAVYTDELDRLVSALAFLITRPTPAARPLLWLARHTEERNPKKVVRALLADG